MVNSRRYCGGIFLSLLALLTVIWIISNLLIDVELEERSGDNRLASAPAESSLRGVFDGLPAEGCGQSRIELFNDNSTAWASRWRLLADAREKIEVSYFILDSDVFGISFLGHLLHKAEKGVQIRIMLDAIGTRLSRQISGNDYLDTLASNGNVRIKMYRPFLFRFRDAFLTLNPAALIASEHDKIIIADGRRALIGGRNIAREYMAQPQDYPGAFRDTDVLLDGAATAAALKAVFYAGFESSKAHQVRREIVDIKDSAAELLLAYEAMDAWVRGRPVSKETASAIREKGLPWLDELEKLPRLRGSLRKKQPPDMRAYVRVLDSRPRLFSPDDAISRSLARLVRAARHDIFIQSPYLILSRPAVSVLEEAAARGVRITILTNSPVSTDNALSQAIFLEQWPEVMARVPTLRLFAAGDTRTIHCKLGAVDGQLGLIGTYNLDPISMSLNGELVAAVWSTEFVERLLAGARNLIADGPVFEYRIVRDAKGRPKRDSNGRVLVAFGPEDHSNPDQWKTIQWYRKLVRLAGKLPGTSSFFM